jgi:hypothetical protein
MQEKDRARLQEEPESAIAKKQKEVGLRVYQLMLKELLDARKSHFSVLVRNCCLCILFPQLVVTHFCKSPP